MSELRDRTKMVLAEHGADDLHSWRCNHPEVYGRCTCLDDLADDLASLARLVQAEAIEEAIEKLMAFDGSQEYSKHIQSLRGWAAAYRVGEGES